MKLIAIAIIIWVILEGLGLIKHNGKPGQGSGKPGSTGTKLSSGKTSRYGDNPGEAFTEIKGYDCTWIQIDPRNFDEYENEDQREIREYGQRGEESVSKEIAKRLSKGDTLITNSNIEIDGLRAEVDNIIVNKYGVFLVEVKTYEGKITGDEEDYEWNKIHILPSGEVSHKKVRNPIRQVRAHAGTVANLLESKGIDLWIEGYAYMTNGNSPVHSDRMIEDLKDLPKLVHSSSSNKRLSDNEIRTIIELLKL